jgi:hypothetical protein
MTRQRHLPVTEQQGTLFFPLQAGSTVCMYLKLKILLKTLTFFNHDIYILRYGHMATSTMRFSACKLTAKLDIR